MNLAIRRGVIPYYCIKINRPFSTHTSHKAVDATTLTPSILDEAALYVHWPFCEKRCTYCNFNKYRNVNVDHKRMEKCLVTETCSLIDLSQVTKINSIFFGGGTPSLAQPSTIQSIIETAAKWAHLSEDAEITLEANPTSFAVEKLQDFKAAGVNRISLGIQALNDQDLKLLGREHTAIEALSCLEKAKELFPGKTSVDLIFGRPGQKNQEWQKELNTVLKRCDRHLSLYQLTLERGTELFRKVMERELHFPYPDTVAEMYETAVKILEENNFHRYEASNFAADKEAESKHNIAVWQGSQYIGVGPGAHGRFVPRADKKQQREARVQTLEPDPWMFEVEKYGHATRKADPLTSYQVLQEILYLGLRTLEGISESRWQEFSGGPSLEDVFGDTYMFRVLQEEGYMQPIDGYLRTTGRGMNLVDSVTKELYDILEKYWELHDLHT